MPGEPALQSAGGPTRRAELRRRADWLLQGGMEALVLVMVAASPWAFGCVEPGAELLLLVGVAALLALWGARMLLRGELSWVKCPVALCLAGLFLFGVWQRTPLPGGLLRGLSPGTAEKYGQLLPARPEVLPFGEGPAAVAPPAGTTVSLYPGGTRRELLQLLAAFALFAVVRNNVTSPAALRRLAVVAVANGALLALVALLQFFTSPPNVVYWSYPAEGNAFGPFICKNHFPFYVNLCVGLGLGLLLRGARPAARSPHRDRHREWFRPLLGLLQEPRTLWVSVALALMLSSVVFSLSRGGFLALLGAAAVCLLVRLYLSRDFLRPGAGLLAVGAALALLAWFGMGRIQARLETLWRGKALEGRLALWAPARGALRDFPLWGEGYGTYQYAELAARDDTQYVGLVSEHAHNDYVEALIEGGLARLGLSLTAIGLVFWLGCRAVRRPPSPAAGGLALGALFAFTTVVLHSAGEFGLHVPAIVMLAAVLCAHLCALGRAGSAAGPGGNAAGAYTLRLAGLAPLTGAVMVVLCALVLVSEGYKAERAHRLRMEAVGPEGAAGSAEAARRIACLEEAAALQPGSAQVHLSLGELHAAAFADYRARRRRADLLGEAARAVALAAAPGPPHPGALPSAWLLASAGRTAAGADEEARQTRQHLLPALRHLVQARDLCPLMAAPHLRIAAHAHEFEEADPQAAYLGRAKLLAPGDPVVWYECGLRELAAGRRAEAADSWRHSLRLADVRLEEILAVSAALPGAGEFLARVLPDRPGLLVEAATRPPGGPEASGWRRPVLLRALTLLGRQGPALSADDLRLKARAHRSLGQPAQARAAYQALLLREPRRIDWRCELAEILYEQGQFREAQRELLAILAEQPGHPGAVALLAAVRRGTAAGP